MTSIEREELPTELLEAIQATLPGDQVIRHSVIAFTTQTDFDDDFRETPSVSGVFHLAVTDSLMAFRVFNWAWDLTDSQLQEKQALESEVYKRFPFKGERVWSDEQVLTELTSKHGQLKWKFLPQVNWSNDIQIADITLDQFVETTPFPFVTDHFAGFPHQKNQICYFQYSGHGWSQVVNSFFGNLHDIYLHIRDLKSHTSREAESFSRITKCTSCGSTELTLRGAYTICDYCQSKFGR
jgi:hypothetical protein